VVTAEFVWKHGNPGYPTNLNINGATFGSRSQPQKLKRGHHRQKDKRLGDATARLGNGGRGDSEKHTGGEACGGKSTLGGEDSIGKRGAEV